MVNLDDALGSEKNSRLTAYGWEQIRRRVLARDGGRCVQCPSTENLEIDHIVPVALGGDHVVENLQTLCEKCHQRKTVNDIERIRRTNKLRKLERRRENGLGGSF